MEVITENFCRICTVRSTETMSIFQYYKFSESYLQIFEVIMKCASIQIKEFDGFSEHICNKCIEHLHQAFNFKQLCEDSDYKFRHNLIVNNQIAIKNEIVWVDANEKSITGSEIQSGTLTYKREEHNDYDDDEINGNNEEHNTSSAVEPEMQSGFYAEEPKIHYGDLNNQLHKVNIQRTCKHEEHNDDEIINNNEEHNTSGNMEPEMQSEFYAEEKNIQNPQMCETNLILDQNSNENSHIREFFSKSFDERTLFNDHNGINTEEEHYFESKAVFIRPNIVHEKSSNSEKRGESYDDEAKVDGEKMIHTLHKCGVCNKYFPLKHILDKHMIMHTMGNLYKCEVCNRTFQHKGSYKTHIKVHTVERTFNCKVCNKTFDHKGHFNTHMKIHTGEKPYKCEVCNKSFIQRMNLVRHIATHTGERAYKCEICNKFYSQKESLDNHKKIHTGERIYKCDFCNKCFMEKVTLQKHINIHIGNKSYKCDICNKSFIDKATLKRHIKIHMGIKSYKCDACNKCFIKNCDLKKHLRIHTGEKPYKCEMCDKCFTRKDNLNMHKKRTHLELDPLNVRFESQTLEHPTPSTLGS